MLGILEAKQSAWLCSHLSYSTGQILQYLAVARGILSCAIYQGQPVLLYRRTSTADAHIWRTQMPSVS